MLAIYPFNHMELERDWISVKERSEQCELAENWETGSEPVSTRQGDPISPTTFILYLERMMDTIKENGTGISVPGHKINNLKFVDDIDLLEEDRDELQENLK